MMAKRRYVKKMKIDLAEVERHVSRGVRKREENKRDLPSLVLLDPPFHHSADRLSERARKREARPKTTMTPPCRPP